LRLLKIILLPALSKFEKLSQYVKKAIVALKNLVENRKTLIIGFQDKSQSWNIGNEPIFLPIVDLFSEFLSKEIQYLDKVIQYMEKGKLSTCKHPKKDHDKCGDVWYCMNCNEDLI